MIMAKTKWKIFIIGFVRRNERYEIIIGFVRQNKRYDMFVSFFFFFFSQLKDSVSNS